MPKSMEEINEELFNSSSQITDIAEQITEVTKNTEEEINPTLKALYNAHYKDRDAKMPRNDNGNVVRFNEFKMGEYAKLAAKEFDKMVKEVVGDKIPSKWMNNLITTKRNEFITNEPPLVKENKKTGEPYSFKQQMEIKLLMMESNLYGRFNSQGEKYRDGLIDVFKRCLNQSYGLANKEELNSMKDDLNNKLDSVNNQIKQMDFSNYNNNEERAMQHKTNLENKLDRVDKALDNISNMNNSDLQNIKAESNQQNITSTREGQAENSDENSTKQFTRKKYN